MLSRPGSFDGPHQLGLDLRVAGQTVHARRRHRRGLARCESPLEQQLALAFAATAGFRMRRPAEHPWEIGRWEAAGIALLAQAPWEGYVTDFALASDGWRPKAAFPVVIEVDGHEFHERTPEQAERDRSRDRAMAAAGTMVLRFTGREINRDASACAQEVLRCALGATHLHNTFTR
jgi:very-short-patch-repair endonuclease